MSRHVAELERQLGLTLFDRRRDGLVLTPKGLELVESARAMRSAAEGIARRAEGLHEDVEGTVRISASEVIAVEYMPDAIAELAVRHPQLAFELVSTNAAVDVTRRQADIAVRMFEPRQPDLIVRRAATLEFGVYASRDYLERRGTPASVRELLEAHVLVGQDERLDLAGPRAAGIPLTREHFVFRSDALLAGNAAVRAGVGIGFLQHRLARRDPELVCLALDFTPPPLPLYVVTLAELRTSARMRVVFDGLVDYFSTLAPID